MNSLVTCRIEGMIQKSRRTRANDNSSGIRRWQHLRPQLRRKKMGTPSPLLRRMVMRDCSKTATAV